MAPTGFIGATTTTFIYNSGQYFIEIPNDEYAVDVTNSTSEAAAHTSGVAALLLSNWNEETASTQNLVQEDIEYLLEIGAEDIEYGTGSDPEKATPGYDKYTGWGLIKADKSLQYLQAPNFDLKHVVTTADGNDVSLLEEDAEISIETDYCYAGIDAGTYIADVYKVVVNTSHSFNASYSIHNISNDHPGYWVLNSMSNLWDYDESTKTTTARTGVTFTSGNTPGISGAELVGYFFYIKEKVRLLGNKDIDKWYPHSDDDEHVVAYSLHLSRCWDLSVQNPGSTYTTYPNPASSILNIQSSNGEEVITAIQLYSMDGKLVDEKIDINAMKYSYPNINNLQGMYLVAIRNRKYTYYAKVLFE